MLTSRQEDILKAIVEEFVQTAEPVGSKLLVEKYDLKFSSATIRNEMNYLETEGYLEKTHTSSGRVPSTKGYRYYVENLLEVELEQEDKYELQQVIFDDNSSIEDVIQKSCEILSQMTNLTSVVLGPEASKQTLAHIKLLPVDDNSGVAVIVTDQGHSETKMFRLNEEITMEDLENCTNILNDRLIGTPISEVIEKMTEIKPILAHSVKKQEALFNAFMQAFVKFASDNKVYYSGTSNMLYQPEFSDVEKLRQMMKMLEDTSLWRQIGQGDVDQKLVSSDNRSELVWVDDLAVVSTKVQLDEEEGRLMVVGPSRMDYNRIAGILDFTSKIIEDQFHKKLK